MSDMLWRGTAVHDQFRVLAVDSTHTVQKARDLHDLSPLATILMGQMISATALLSMDLKTPGADVSLKVAGDGALAGAMVICTREAHIRGYVEQPHIFFEEASLNNSLSSNLGEGTLSVIKKYPEKSPWIGTIVLEPGEIAENIARYYHDSEQIPAMVNLGVLFDREARIKAAGGFVVQQLPDTDPLLVDKLIANLAATPNVSDLMDMGMEIPDILRKFIFKGEDLLLEDAQPLSYQCNCSRERFGSALRLLGKEELSTMTDGITPVCHFCAAQYHFSAEDIHQLMLELDGYR